ASRVEVPARLPGRGIEALDDDIGVFRDDEVGVGRLGERAGRAQADADGRRRRAADAASVASQLTGARERRAGVARADVLPGALAVADPEADGHRAREVEDHRAALLRDGVPADAADEQPVRVVALEGPTPVRRRAREAEEGRERLAPRDGRAAGRD